MLEVQTPRSNICAYQKACLLLVKSEEVGLPIAMVHVPMQFEDMTIKHGCRIQWSLINCYRLILNIFFEKLCIFVVFPSFIGALFPVDFFYDLCKKVDSFTVARKYYHFLILMAVEESQKVHQPILGGYFHPELLDLLRN